MDLLARILNIRNFVQKDLGKHSNKIKEDCHQVGFGGGGAGWVGAIG